MATLNHNDPLNELRFRDFSNLSSERISHRTTYREIADTTNKTIVCKNKIINFIIPTQELIRLKFEGQLEEYIQKRLKSQLIASLPDLKYQAIKDLKSSTNPYGEEGMTRITTAIYIEDIQ